MRKLKISVFSLILVLAFIVCAGIFSFAVQSFAQPLDVQQSPVQPSPATVEDLSADKYFPGIKKALSEAHSSINLVMYFANFEPNDTRSKVYQLVDELVKAHGRGVKVKVILDQNIDYSNQAPGGGWKREEKNDALFLYLKKQGIEVFYDNLYIVTHGKAAVIDDEIVVLGSANWSDASLSRNGEISCLIRSKELAGQILEDFSRITLDYEASVLDEQKLPPIRLNREFLTNPACASGLLSAHDESAFNLYLYLLRIFDGNAEASVEINYKDIYLALGMDKGQSFNSARVDLQKTLTRLEKHKLLTIVKRTPRSPVVFLKDYGEAKPYTVPQQMYCSIPGEYWQYGWHKTLSFPEKYCYLINLDKAGSLRGHSWSSFQGIIIRDYNINKWAIIRGMKGLRIRDIIEVDYPEYSDHFPYQEKEPTRFTLLGLYSPEVLEKEKQRLAAQYGKEPFAKALQYAQLVYKGNDIQVIEDIISKIDECGSAEVDRAFKIVADKSYSNPKRSYKYVVGILQDYLGPRKDPELALPAEQK